MSIVCSIFSQVLKLIPRADFDSAVRKHDAERNAKGFTCWGQLVAMLFCQLGSVNSLRDITNGLAASEGKLRHLGLPAAPKRSTLAYANAHRPSALFENLFYRMLEVARSQGRWPGQVFTSGAPTMDCAPSKLRLLRLGWESTRVCPASGILPRATGLLAGTRSSGRVTHPSRSYTHFLNKNSAVPHPSRPVRRVGCTKVSSPAFDNN